MDKDIQVDEKSLLEAGFKKIAEALDVTVMATKKSRELSLVATKLEEAAMWLNKHRANLGYLERSETHLRTE